MRRRRFRHPQRGMTLLEIMIVLAILALVMGLVVGPKLMELFARSKEDVAMLAINKLANEAYPQWVVQHRNRECPDIDQLVEMAGHKSADDPWGRPYKLFCPPSLPAGAKGIAIVSAGPDGKEGTGDDIKSW
jgi:general secretion pathway protein G